MNRKKVSFLGILMALMFLLMGFIPAIKRTDVALAQGNSNDNSGIIFHLTDSVSPILDSTTLTNEFIDYDYVNYQLSNERTFISFLSDILAEASGNDRVCVILELLITFPANNELEYFFSEIKENDYITVFITSFERSEFQSNTDEVTDEFAFEEYIDYIQYYAFRDRINAFFDAALNAFALQCGGVSMSAYLLDGNQVRLGINQAWELNDGDILAENCQVDFEALCEEFLFLKMFVDNLVEDLGYSDENQQTDYNSIADFLKDEKYIKLYVHCYGDVFVDILSWEVRVLDSYSGILVEDEIVRACAFGVWALDSELYNCLLNKIQNGNFTQFPVYLIIRDPIQWGTGLIIAADTGFSLDYINTVKLDTLDWLSEMLLEE